MPYYDTINIPEAIISANRNVTKTTGAISVAGGEAASQASIERGFRTYVPKGVSVKTVPDSVADPYSWFVDLNALKQRAAVKRGQFDAAAFRTDVGHPWQLEKFQLMQPAMDFSIKWAATTTDRYWSAFPHLSVDTGLQSGYHVPPLGDLQSWAALKYASMAPTSDKFSVPAFVGELREGLPRLVSSLAKARSVAETARGAGSDYLNVQFGWLPLLNDLRSIAEKLFRYSGGLFAPWGATHRTRGESPEIVQRGQQVAWGSVAYGDYYDGPFKPYLEGSGQITSAFISGVGIVSRQTSTNRWMEGEFVLLPKAGFDPEKYMDRFDTLFKTDLTPSDLWQLAPWSWLADWFIDIGGAISALETGLSDRVLSTYCYAMEKVESKTSILCWDIVGETGKTYSGPRSYSQTWNYTRLRRIRANPFGFTLNPTVSLNLGQMAILGALGLTKIRR
jgi:hypothetical protein